MSRVVVTWSPQPGERDVVADVLGDDAAWLGDDPAAQVKGAEVALMFWPRRELKAMGLAPGDLQHLRLVQLATAGANHVGWNDWPDVPVATAPGATGPFIAEYVLGTVLAWSRGLLRYTQEIKRGRFRQGDMVRGLRDVRVGLVGFGGIGRSVARLLGGLGCTLAAVSRSGVDDTELLAWHGTMDQLPRLAAESDVLVLCLPLTTDTLGLVDLDVLANMAGRPSLLVNVARGPIVKEGDLFAWLDSDHTRHMAALDVWWQYPKHEGKPFEYPFDTLPNVLMTPHNSPNVPGYRLAMLEAACHNVRRALEGDVRHVVDAKAHRLPVEGDGR